MLVYTSTKTGFLADVQANRIETEILSAFETSLGHSTSPNEVASWKNSMQYMQNVLLDEGIPGDTGVAIEYRIPQTAKRIDFILTGQNHDQDDCVVIVELKQWSAATATTKDGVVETFLGGGRREVPHPSYQAWTYAALLEDFNEEVYSTGIQLRPCAYLHNCADGAELLDDRYAEHLEQAPLYLKRDTERLVRFIKNHVRKGDRGDLLYRIDKGRIRPSKNLADCLASLLAGNKEFLMIDDQKLVFETVIELAALSESGKKQVLIVHGGPGTGKSVVAINLLVELTNRERTVQYITRNAAPRSVYEAKLAGSMKKTRITNLFRGSGGFTKSEADVFDCLLIDEAHRLNAKSGMFAHLGENQIKELIFASRLSVFFIDQHQRVTLKDIGSEAEITSWARQQGAELTTLRLASQFRCNGSDGYLAWVDNCLQIEPTATDSLSEVDYEFRVFDSASEMRRAILKANVEANKARMVAGYCWPWKSKKDKAAMDIVLEDGDFAMQWNLNEDGSLWILKPDSVNQIGCIHTCQGLEVDYVGVLFGRDLIVRDGVVMTNASERASQDTTVRGYKKMSKAEPERAQQLTEEIIKNTYRTLMTRGQNGCFVHSVDPETNQWLQARVGQREERETMAVEVASARPLPFRLMSSEEVEPFVNAVPVYELEAAAGRFSDVQDVGVETGWAELPAEFRPHKDLFIAKVVGESMNRRVPSGSWCLFRANPAGTRQGRVVLAQHRGIMDPETSGQYTVKVYSSEYSVGEDGERRGRVALRPDSTEVAYQMLEFSGDGAGELAVLAELVAVLG